MRLLLFDIDGTLIRSHRAGRMAMESALIELFGEAGPLESYPMSGKTDHRILSDLLVSIGLDEKEIAAKLPLVYEVMTEKARQIYPDKGIAPCPGVGELLSALRVRKDVVLGLLTGNIETTAPLKLQAAGIEPWQFVVGAYGSDSGDRNQLPAIVMDRASQLTNHPFAGNNTVIIGDTPADILCARAGKAAAIAVASGWHSKSTLAKYQPDHLLDNLTDTATVMRLMLDSSDA
jgi:phosphoglycolate phosphatase